MTRQITSKRKQYKIYKKKLDCKTIQDQLNDRHPNRKNETMPLKWYQYSIVMIT